MNPSSVEVRQGREPITRARIALAIAELVPSHLEGALHGQMATTVARCEYENPIASRASP